MVFLTCDTYLVYVGGISNRNIRVSAVSRRKKDSFKILSRSTHPFTAAVAKKVSECSRSVLSNFNFKREFVCSPACQSFLGNGRNKLVLK